MVKGAFGVAHFPAGLQIPGNRVTGFLARGGMGAVFAAEDANLGRPVAVKQNRRPSMAAGSSARPRSPPACRTRIQQSGLGTWHWYAVTDITTTTLPTGNVVTRITVYDPHGRYITLFNTQFSDLFQNLSWSSRPRTFGGGEPFPPPRSWPESPPDVREEGVVPG